MEQIIHGCHRKNDIGQLTATLAPYWQHFAGEVPQKMFLSIIIFLTLTLKSITKIIFCILFVLPEWEKSCSQDTQ